MITAHIATFPPRAPIIRKAVHSIINQVDKVFIYFNEYSQDTVPSWVKDNDKIVWECSESSGYGDLGDVGKFYFCSDEMRERYGITGTIFTCDDDLIFPYWYVRRSMAYLNGDFSNSILSYHGSVLDPNCSDYHTKRASTHHVRFNVPHVNRIHTPGTGCAIFRLDTFSPSLSMFDHTNMSDIFVGRWANNNNVKVFVLPHKTGDFKYLNAKSTIWDATKGMDGTTRDRRSQTIEVIESTDWTRF